MDYARFKVDIADEITEFQNGRYLSASKAAWRFFEYETTRRIPSVDNYPVHLSGENYVVYQKGTADCAVSKIWKLERYFCRPVDDRFDNVKYLEYYEKYQVVNREPKLLRSDEI